jgi:peptide/nickel transport system substrate-binding protein
MLNWSPDYFDPHANSDSFAHNTDNSDTAAIHPLAWRNHWLIPEISQQVAEAAKELDATKRAAMYAALEKKVTDDGPFIIMFQNTPQVAMRANVKDFIFALDYDNYKKVKKS